MTLVLVGVIIGVALWPGALAYRRATGRNRPQTLRSTDAVNVFEGTVFPAPHDARWRIEWQEGENFGRYAFGDSDITLTKERLRIGETEVAGSAERILEQDIHHAGFGKNEKKPAEAQKALPAPTVDANAPLAVSARMGTYRIGAMSLPRPDDPKWLAIYGDEYRYFYDEVRCLTVSRDSVVFGVVGRPDDRRTAIICQGPEAQLYQMGIAQAMWARGQQAALLDGQVLLDGSALQVAQQAQLANARWGRG